ncbi:MAG TPA: hypothetical protein PLL66_03780 [Bacteroidales bacterium]|nr:hypothetical protein [Bacteroidales bacterium]
MKVDHEKSLKKQIQISESMKTFRRGLKTNKIFLNDFANLLYVNNSKVFIDNKLRIYYFQPVLIENAVNTLESISLCCKEGHFADANTLIRKFRDDLLLFVFILFITDKRHIFNEEDLSYLKFNHDVKQNVERFLNLRINEKLDENENAVFGWFNNTISDQPRNVRNKLGFENYMKTFKSDPKVVKFLTDYDLQEYWDKLSPKLNNFVHNNGIHFTEQNIITRNYQVINSQLKELNDDISFVCSFFLILIIVFDPSLIRSTDYDDYRDLGLEPIENSQFFIPRFIQKYIDSNVSMLHPELKEFLKANKYGMMIK